MSQGMPVGHTQRQTHRLGSRPMNTPALPRHVVKQDIDVVLWSIGLHQIRRFVHQRYWEHETELAEHAARIEGDTRIESVAEHSWHVADMAMLLAPRFAGLDAYRCACLALLHDKLEIITGDWDPVGNGSGDDTHAFSALVARKKEMDERAAADEYLGRLEPSVRAHQARLLHEYLDGKSAESSFVRAVDKLQALAYVYTKKQGAFEDAHLAFTIRYSGKCRSYYGPISAHFEDLRDRLIESVAHKRNVNISDIWETLAPVVGPRASDTEALAALA